MRYAAILTAVALGWFFAGASPAWAADADLLGLGVEVRYWRPQLEAKVRSSTDLLSGTKVDLGADLNLDDRPNTPYVKLSLGGSQRLTASALMLRVEGKEHPDVNFDFGGSQFTTAMDVKTKLDADIYRVAWEADWLDMDLEDFGGVRLGTILGAEIFDVSASIQSNTGLSETAGGTAPVPIVGLQGAVDMPLGFSVFGEVAGMKASFSGVEGSLLEFEAGIKYRIAFAFATLSWHEMRVYMRDDENRVDLRLSGPALGVGVAF